MTKSRTRLYPLTAKVVLWRTIEQTFPPPIVLATRQASIYPSLEGYLIARNKTLYSGFPSGMGAYLACGWRAAGPHFAYPGVITLVAIFWHCWYASIYRSDNEKLQEELAEACREVDMGDWLYTSNFYRPELQSLEMPR